MLSQERGRGICCVARIVLYPENPLNVIIQMIPFLYQLKKEIIYTLFVLNESTSHLGFVFRMLLTHLALTE